jgi:hypothetical protein
MMQNGNGAATIGAREGYRFFTLLPRQLFVADRLTAVKWRDRKMHLIEQVNMYDVPQTLALPRVYNLLTDLKEERDVTIYNTWVTDPMLKIISDLEASLKKYPAIKLGTADPYTPPQ